MLRSSPEKTSRDSFERGVRTQLESKGVVILSSSRRHNLLLPLPHDDSQVSPDYLVGPSCVSSSTIATRKLACIVKSPTATGERRLWREIATLALDLRPHSFFFRRHPRPPFMEVQADCVADAASYQDAQCSFFLSEEESALTDGVLASSVMVIASSAAMLLLVTVVSVMFIWKYRRKLLCKPSVQEPCDANADVIYDEVTDFRRRQIPLQLQEIPHDSSPESTVFVSHYQQPPDHYNQVYKEASQSSGESCADSDDDNGLSDHTYKSLTFLEQASPDWSVEPTAPMDDSRVRYLPSAPPRQEIYCAIDSDSGFSQNTCSGRRR